MLLADPLRESAIPEGWSLQERLCVFEFQSNASLTAMPTLLYSKQLTSMHIAFHYGSVSHLLNLARCSHESCYFGQIITFE